MTKNNNPPDENRAARPSELMRSWHPDLFSDSDTTHEPIVPREVLDHYLETLTNRNQEKEFEYFARLLAECEICPNLRPQTGPTGGGDSKVDTETYPVATELSSQWYYGEPEAASERWAFAFSIKKKWRDKIKSDVENVISTGRPYNRVIFITNQYAPEKQRAEREDALTKQSGIPVTIIDRSWILEKIYSNKRVDLAIRALGMSDYTQTITARAGPRDTARQAELELLDAAVADRSRYDGAPYALAEDALQSALLARGLGRSRHEVEGRFLAATRIAANVGHKGQMQRIAYNRAWTTHWWFEDFGLFSKLYDEVAEHALDSENAADLEQLTTLWNLLLTAVDRGHLKEERAQTAVRGASLRTALNRMAAMSERPNNAAEARTSLAVMQAVHLMQARKLDKLPEVWNELRSILASVQGLGEYPVDRVYNFVARLGEFVPESEAFDTLFDDLVGLIEKRRSEAEGGIALMRRGVQKLEKNRPYDAIRMLGRAETRLIKAEYADELVHTLVVISQAYRQVDLLWAARAKALIASDRLLRVFGRDGRLDPRSAVPLKMLAWLELQLGRLPQSLSAIELYRVVAGLPSHPEMIATKISDDLQTLEGVLGMLLMRADLEQLRALERAPAMLERRGFSSARCAMIWALGAAPAVRRHGLMPEDYGDAKIDEFFNLWTNQPASKDLPTRLTLFCGEDDLRSVILGVVVVIRVAHDRTSIMLGEAILAALESLLSTSLGSDVFPYREKIELSVRPAVEPTTTPAFKVDETSGKTEIIHGTGEFAGASEYSALTEWLRDLLIHLTLSIVVISDPEQWLNRIARDEIGFSRALALTGISIATYSVFGNKPRLLLDDWIDSADLHEPLTRDAALAPPREPLTDGQGEPLQFGGDAPPKDSAFDPEAGGHSERRVVSPINIPLWDRAGWTGTGFGWGGSAPPILMLAFRDYEAGKAIFREWRERYRTVDEQRALRISFIRGVDCKQPSAYSVVVGPEINVSIRSGETLVFASRIQRMYPIDSRNLTGFIEQFLHHKQCVVIPAPLDITAVNPSVEAELGLVKCTLVIREAWTIGPNEPDASCINVDDRPVIPEDIVDPPITRTIKWKRSLPRRFGDGATSM